MNKKDVIDRALDTILRYMMYRGSKPEEGLVK